MVYLTEELPLVESPLTTTVSLEYCPVFGWGRVNFLPSSRYSAVFLI